MTWYSNEDSAAARPRPSDGPQDRLRGEDAQLAGQVGMPVLGGPLPEALGGQIVPATSNTVVPAGPPVEENRFMSDLKRSGHWVVPQQARSRLVFSDATIDFREAEIAPGESHLSAHLVCSDMKVIVPPHVAVEVRGSVAMGDVKIDLSGGSTQATSRLIITVSGMLSDVKVKTFPVGERVPRRWKWL